MISKIRQASKFKILLATLLIVAAGAGGALALTHHKAKPQTTPVPAPANVKLLPPTPEEKQEADQNKDRIVTEQQQQNNQSSSQSSNTKKQVSVIISHAGQDSVNAYVNGVFEDGGTCSATFTQNSTVVTRTSNGFENVSYTQCAPITPNLPNSGGWSVVVSYSSSSAEGKSAAQAF